MFSLEGLRRIQELELSRKRVFVRADLNCAFTADGQLLDDSKVVALARTVRELQDREAHIIVGGHRDVPAAGRHQTTVASLEAVATRLAELLNIEVFLPEEISGPMARKLISELKEGRIVMFENLLSFPGEADNDEGFARELAAGIDVYIGDCLTSPGAFASLQSTPKLCHDKAIGLGLESELVAVNRLLRQGVGKRVFFVGESFESQRLLLQKLLANNLTICAAGQLSATLLAARGASVRDAEKPLLAEARSWLSDAEAKGTTVLLPVDARVIAPPGKAVELGTLRWGS